jgi:Na+/melibiose symporter-like transporter
MSSHPQSPNQKSSQTPPKINPPADRHDPFAVLRIRDFRLFAIGRILIFTSFQMQTVALGWEIYDRTGSALALGGVGLAQVTPMILLTLLTGHVADRHDRKNTILFAIFLSILCSLGLAAISYGKGAIAWVYVLLALIGIGTIAVVGATLWLFPDLKNLGALVDYREPDLKLSEVQASEV